MVVEKHSASSIWKGGGRGAERSVVISDERLDAYRLASGVCYRRGSRPAQSEENIAAS